MRTSKKEYILRCSNKLPVIESKFQINFPRCDGVIFIEFILSIIKFDLFKEYKEFCNKKYNDLLGNIKKRFL